MKEVKAGKIEIETDRLIIRTPEDKDAYDNGQTYNQNSRG